MVDLSFAMWYNGVGGKMMELGIGVDSDYGVGEVLPCMFKIAKDNRVVINQPNVMRTVIKLRFTIPTNPRWIASALREFAVSHGYVKENE